jgi:hypothetical protein
VMPTSGLWVYSATVYAYCPGGFGGLNASVSSWVGLGTAAAPYMVCMNPLSNSANSWGLDARGFTGLPTATGYVTFGGADFVNAPCLTKIYMDLDNKKVWATITNQTTNVTATSPQISYTSCNAMDSWVLGECGGGSLFGLPTDNFSLQQIVDTSISYQGKLSNNGQPMNGTASVAFGLFTASTGGTAVWSSTAANVTVTNGVFSTSIGPVSANVFQENKTLWLEVTINGQVMSPRAQLQTAPYAATAFTTF